VVGTVLQEALVYVLQQFWRKWRARWDIVGLN
jgi:hypothetical protein